MLEGEAGPREKLRPPSEKHFDKGFSTTKERKHRPCREEDRCLRQLLWGGDPERKKEGRETGLVGPAKDWGAVGAVLKHRMAVREEKDMRPIRKKGGGRKPWGKSKSKRTLDQKKEQPVGFQLRKEGKKNQIRERILLP